MKDRESIEKAAKRGQMITKQDLAKLYQVSWETIRNWVIYHPDLNQYRDRILSQKNYLTPAQYRFLFEHLGTPFENEI